jgi:hypothetical protein
MSGLNCENKHCFNFGKQYLCNCRKVRSNYRGYGLSTSVFTNTCRTRQEFLKESSILTFENNQMEILEMIFGNKMLKIGIDFHGVLNKYYSFIKSFIRNHEIQIITGSMHKSIKDELNQYYYFNKFFSVSDYLISQNAKVTFKDENNPYFDLNLWNRQKGEYCKREGIDIHFDDSIEYAEYFDPKITKFVLIK